MSQAASHAAAFYREVAANRMVWTVRDDAGFPAPRNSEGWRTQPFWSSRSRAERILGTVAAFAEFRVIEVPWDEFRSRWVPGLTSDRVLVGVNWSGARAFGYDVEPADVVRNVESLGSL